jgi:hypothetical protein
MHGRKRVIVELFVGSSNCRIDEWRGKLEVVGSGSVHVPCMYNVEVAEMHRDKLSQPGQHKSARTNWLPFLFPLSQAFGSFGDSHKIRNFRRKTDQKCLRHGLNLVHGHSEESKALESSAVDGKNRDLRCCAG